MISIMTFNIIFQNNKKAKILEKMCKKSLKKAEKMCGNVLKKLKKCVMLSV